MKKYILGMLAIVLVVGASAFIKSNKNAPETVYYWYKVDANGDIVSGSQAFMRTAETVSYATSNLPCPAGNQADCIRGFANAITSFPTNAHGDTSPLQKRLP